MYCAKSHNSSATPQDDLVYHIVKTHSVPKPYLTFKCNLCYRESRGFHALGQHKVTQHGFPLRTASVGLDDIPTKSTIRILKKSCVHINIYELIWTWIGETQSVQLYNRKAQRNISGRETRTISQQFKKFSMTGFGFRVQFKKYRRR